MASLLFGAVLGAALVGRLCFHAGYTAGRRDELLECRKLFGKALGYVDGKPANDT